MKAAGHPGYDDDSQYPDDDYEREPWCRDFENHKTLHEFCGHHQAVWCRKCDRHGQCPECVEDPHCPRCGAAIFQEEHNWDCIYAGED